MHSSFLTDFQQTVNLCTQDIHTLHQELQNFSQQINSLSEENRKLEEIIQKLNQVSSGIVVVFIVFLAVLSRVFVGSR